MENVFTAAVQEGRNFASQLKEISDAIVNAAVTAVLEKAAVVKPKRKRMETITIVTTEQYRPRDLYSLRKRGWKAIGVSTTPAGNIMLTSEREVE